MSGIVQKFKSVSKNVDNKVRYLVNWPAVSGSGYSSEERLAIKKGKQYSSLFAGVACISVAVITDMELSPVSSTLTGFFGALAGHGVAAFYYNSSYPRHKLPEEDEHQCNAEFRDLKR